MFRRWRHVACVEAEIAVLQARKIRKYIEKHLGNRVDCKLEMPIGDGDSRMINVYMRLNNNEAAFVRGLTDAEGFYYRATKE